MPVLFRGACARPDSVDSTNGDIEALVFEVKDRLCLKNQEKRYPDKRTVPYQRSNPRDLCSCVNKHYSSPSSVYQHRVRHRTIDRCSRCKKCPKPSFQKNVSDATSLLEKLLSEQSLIQEAVRRLQTQRHEKTLSTDATQKVFPSLAYKDSSNENASASSRFVTSYSESEDDSLSQHSVDL